MSTPCPALICTPPDDLLSYSLQGLTNQLRPVPPYTNAEVSWCCDAGLTLAFTGTLPDWITIENDCLVGAAGKFYGNNQAVATQLAQTALDGFASTQQTLGNLTCSTPPVPVCAPPLFERIEFDGTLANTDPVSTIFTSGGNHYSQRFTFSGTAGMSVAVYLRASFWPAVALLDPSLATLETDDSTYGFGPGIVRAAGITYTLPSTGTYTVEVSTSSSLTVGTFVLVVSDGVEKVFSGLDSPWRMIYVASSHRVFVLGGYKASTATIYVYDSTDDTFVGSVALQLSGGPIFDIGQPTLFYNPNDDSVWACTRDQTNPYTQWHYFRLDPSTGAIIEDIAPIGRGVNYFGAFVPSVNKIFGADALSITDLKVFNCSTRLYETDIPLGTTITSEFRCKYIEELDVVVAFADDRYFLVNPNDSSITQVLAASNFFAGFYKDGLYYTARATGGNPIWSIDLLTGTHVDTIDNGYVSDGIEYNPCRDRIMISAENGASPNGFLVGSMQLDGTPTESVICHKDSNNVITSWDQLLWNPDSSRMYFHQGENNFATAPGWLFVLS